MVSYNVSFYRGLTACQYSNSHYIFESSKYSENKHRLPPPLLITLLLQLCVQRVNQIRGVFWTSTKFTVKMFVTKSLKVSASYILRYSWINL